jgi:hypothetical protein
MNTHREGFTPPHGDVPLFDHSMTLPVEIGRAHSLGQLQSTAAAEYRAGVEAGRKQMREEVIAFCENHMYGEFPTDQIVEAIRSIP